MDDIDLYNIAEAAVRLFEHLPGIALAKAIDYELKFREDILARPKDHSISARQYEEGQRWNQNMLERLKALQSIIPLPSTVRKR